MASKRFQGLCLLAVDGWLTMRDYDQLPEVVRDRLMTSAFNLCAACVENSAYAGPGTSERQRLHRMLAMIEEMEAILREEQG